MNIRWITEAEQQQIKAALGSSDVEKLRLTVEYMSPWLQIDAWVHMEGWRKLALWRDTGAVYALDSQGAVEDDPFIPAKWGVDDVPVQPKDMTVRPDDSLGYDPDDPELMGKA